MKTFKIQVSDIQRKCEKIYTIKAPNESKALEIARDKACPDFPNSLFIEDSRDESILSIGQKIKDLSDNMQRGR